MQLEKLSTANGSHGSLPQLEECAWPERIRAGSLPAFEAMFKMYYREMVSFAGYKVHREDVAEEIVQDIFLNIWRDRRTWQPRGSLRTYLLGAVRNHSLGYLRHRKVEKRWAGAVREEVPDATPEDRLAYKELSRMVEEAIDALPERRRIIFSLSRQQGLSYGEIAALLKISPKTVENQMSHALRFLRQRLSGFLPACLTLIFYLRGFLF